MKDLNIYIIIYIFECLKYLTIRIIKNIIIIEESNVIPQKETKNQKKTIQSNTELVITYQITGRKSYLKRITGKKLLCRIMVNIKPLLYVLN